MAEINQISEKHAKIDKANAKILIAIGLSTFIIIFSAFAIKSLISQSSYNQRVINKKQDALQTLKDNKNAVEDLRASYLSFATEPLNVIGGNPNGIGSKDGDNAKLVLDSLPSDYDYPALSSSIEKILLDGGYQIKAIGGIEDSTQQLTANSTSTVDTAPIEMPYPLSVQAGQAEANNLLLTFESSIRPFKIKTISITGGDGSLNLNINMDTYYQPSIGLRVTEEVVE